MSLQKRCVSKIMDNDCNCDDIISSCDVKTRLQIVKSLKRYIIPEDLNCSGFSIDCQINTCDDCGYHFILHYECNLMINENHWCDYRCVSCDEYTGCRNCYNNRIHKEICNDCYNKFLNDETYVCKSCFKSNDIIYFCNMCSEVMMCIHQINDDMLCNDCIITRSITCTHETRRGYRICFEKCSYNGTALV